MISYVVKEWKGYFMVIEIDDTQEKVDASIVFGGNAEDTYEDCEQWIEEMEGNGYDKQEQSQRNLSRKLFCEAVQGMGREG